MDIHENQDGSFTATPEDFRDCAYEDPGDESGMGRSDCWYTGATHGVTYTQPGLDGRCVIEVCEDHIDAAILDLEDPRRWPEKPHSIITVKIEQ